MMWYKTGILFIILFSMGYVLGGGDNELNALLDITVFSANIAAMSLVLFAPDSSVEIKFKYLVKVMITVFTLSIFVSMFTKNAVGILTSILWVVIVVYLTMKVNKMQRATK